MWWLKCMGSIFWKGGKDWWGIWDNFENFVISWVIKVLIELFNLWFIWILESVFLFDVFWLFSYRNFN